MASLDSLPADQRAVLQLVLQRGRSYEDIARLLSIDRDAVRQRALTALDTLGPQTGLPDQRRAVITDYLLGQLPEPLRTQTRDCLAESAAERAWARVLAAELSPLVSGSLPEIPLARSPAAEAPVAEVAPAAHETPAADEAPPAEVEPVAEAQPHDHGSSGGAMRSSRRGGAILIALAGLIVVAVVVVLLVNSGGSSKHSASTTQSASAPAASSTATSSTSTAARVVAQINLMPPSTASKAAGIAEVLKEGANNGIAIVAQNVPANKTKPPNAYAVWLYNSASDAHILGFVNPGVGKNGRLSTAGGLPANASHFKQLVVTVETRANPKTPGTIILKGALTGLS